MPITVHHLDNSRSQRILWLLEELGLEYTIREWKRGPDMRAPKGLCEIHPLGFAPMVEVDGQVFVESGAIIDSLLDRFDPDATLRPTSLEALDRYRFWLHYAEGSVMPPLLVKLITGRLRTKVPFLAKPLTGAIANKIDGSYTDAQIDRHLSFIDDELSKHEWLCAAFSAADIQMGFPLLASRNRAPLPYGHINAWLDRCSARPAFQRAMERGGPLTL